MKYGELVIPEKQQRVLPFFPPYIWREGYCGRCGDDTFLDDRFPLGWCESCVKECNEHDGEDETTKHRQKTRKFFLKECPDWKC